MCCNPMKAFYTGNLTEKGKMDFVVLSGSAGDLLLVSDAIKRSRYKTVGPSANIVRVGGHTYLSDPVPIPCGHCVECRMQKAKDWKVRLCHEAERFPVDQRHFVTLTYGDWSLPSDSNGVPTLRPDHWEDFYDRLRHPHYGERYDFRYFACGEYGSLTHRPHFHMILLGKLDDLVPYAWQSFHSRRIDAAWRHRGVTQVKPVEENMIAYVCGYVEKKQMDPFWEEYPYKPFTMKSRGLGFNYVDRIIDGVPSRKVYGIFGNHFSRVPRSYLRQCEKMPWYKEYKAESVRLGRASLATMLGAAGTADEEVLGYIVEASLSEKLKDLRIDKL